MHRAVDNARRQLVKQKQFVQLDSIRRRRIIATRLLRKNLIGMNLGTGVSNCIQERTLSLFQMRLNKLTLIAILTQLERTEPIGPVASQLSAVATSPGNLYPGILYRWHTQIGNQTSLTATAPVNPVSICTWRLACGEIILATRLAIRCANSSLRHRDKSKFNKSCLFLTL